MMRSKKKHLKKLEEIRERNNQLIEETKELAREATEFGQDARILNCEVFTQIIFDKIIRLEETLERKENKHFRKRRFI